MSDIRVHWSRVDDASSEADGPVVYAIWPSPVNPDVCFAAAGFTDFGDHEDEWDAAMVDRLLAELSAFGAPRLLSEPLFPQVPLLCRLFRQPEALPLADQVILPMLWDSCPDCVVAFGDGGASVRTGCGHVIFWVALPAALVPRRDEAPMVVVRAAGGHPLVHTTLVWARLRPAGVAPAAHPR
jgi:hypothetical protein